MAARGETTDRPMNELSTATRRLIIGISGASGVIYGVRLLQLLRNAGVETHLVMTKTAEITFAHETNLKIADVKLTEADRSEIGAVLAQRQGPDGDTFELERDREGRHGRIMKYNLSRAAS